jgi:hypothetical protein
MYHRKYSGRENTIVRIKYSTYIVSLSGPVSEIRGKERILK